MKLQEIVAALPESWVMQGNCRAHKRQPSLKAKRAMLDPHEVGMMRLKEMQLPFHVLSAEQVERIGQCSIDRTYIMVVREGKTWTIVRYTREMVCKYRGHGYIIKGKKVIPLQHHKQGTLEELMVSYEHESDCPLDVLDAEGLFHAFQGRRIHKGKKKGGESSIHQMCKKVCEAQDLSRPWKRGERVHMRAENRKRREAERKEQTALGIIRVARVGLIYKSNTKAVQMKNIH